MFFFKIFGWKSYYCPLPRGIFVVKTISKDTIEFLSFPYIIQELVLLEDEVGKSFVVDASSVADHSIASPISDHHCNYVQGKRPTRPWRKILNASKEK